jgi:hypothetical protein
VPIRDALLRILNELQNARKEPFSGHPLAHFIRDEAPKQLEEALGSHGAGMLTGFKTGDKVLAVQNADVTKISDFNTAIGEAIANKVGGVRVLISGPKGRRWLYLALAD